MAISNYLQKCDYRIGGLKPYIYLIHKNALKLNFKAKGVDVKFKNTSTEEKDIYKVNAAMCIFNQEETYQNKYRFNNTLEVTINEQYKEPFFYGLRTLRTNEYYIIIEDKKGVQYLINAELYTNLNYEYNFTDTENTNNSVLLTWNNLSNYPLLIMEERVDSNKILLYDECPYNLGQAFSLIMTQHNDLKTKDDGVKATEIYIDDVEKLKKIEYLKETFTLNETYDGNMFRVSLSYSIPLDDNQFNWHYNLLEFDNNKYTAVLRTTNDNYVIAGIENGLFPKYNITTSEDDETPNMVNITFTQLSQYPIIYTDDITQYRWFPDGELCFGFDKYQMLVQQQSLDWGETWENTEPEVKKKGDIIESDSEECKDYQWVDDDNYCKLVSTVYVKWQETDLFVCEDGNKYEKLQKYTSEDGKTYTASNEYAKGDLLEENADECSYVAIRWVDVDNKYICYPVNEDLTHWEEVPDVATCVDYGSYKVEKEMVSNNGNIWYESGEERVGDLIQRNNYSCGWDNVSDSISDINLCITGITDSTVETNIVNGFTFDLYEDDSIYNINLQGKGTYTLDIFLPNVYQEYRNDFYIMFSRLDEDLIYTATTNTSNSVGTTSYNKCVYYGGYKYGTWSYTIEDDNQHRIQIGHLTKNNTNVSVEGVCTLQSPLKDYTLYREGYVDRYTSENKSYIIKTLYRPSKRNCCACGFVNTEYRYDSTLCSSAITDVTSINETREYPILYDDWTVDTFTIKGQGTYTIVPKIMYNDSSATTYNNYIQLSRLDEDIKLTATTYTSTASTSSYNYGAYYRGNKYGYWTYTIDDDEVHTFQIGTKRTSTSSSYTGRTAQITLQSPICEYSKYDKYYLWEYCHDEYADVENKTDVYKYELKEYHSCDCDYTGTTYEWDGKETICGHLIGDSYDSTSEYEVWRETNCNGFTGNVDYRNPITSCTCGYREYEYEWDGEETICGSILNGDNPSLTINSVEGNWTREGNTFTSNKISHSETTVERIYFNVSKPTSIIFTINQSSEKCCDYLIIGNLDSSVTNNTGSSYNYCNWQNKSNGTTSMTINDSSEHYIELMYRKDGSVSNGTDNVIVTLSIENVGMYDSTSMYEVWREWEYCLDDTSYDKLTGNVDYRNPQKSYDCDWITYQWREDEDNVCGNALPDNTTEVSEAPEINTDFE